MEFEEMFIKRSPEYGFLMARMRAALGVECVKFSDINSVHLHTFKTYMEGEVTNNSLKTYFAVFKAFCNEAYNDGFLSNIKCLSVLKVKTTPSQHCCLTEEELIKFDEYKPKTQTEKDVKILFMRGALSGARSCDCAVMTSENMFEGHLTYVSKKTKVGVVQPIHSRLPKYLAMEPSKVHHRAVVNRIIREICKSLGFDEPVTLSRNGKMVTKPKYEWITMHASRRTFCTSLAVRSVPVEVIARLAGHNRSETTSKHYICIDTKDIGEEALSFFNS